MAYSVPFKPRIVAGRDLQASSAGRRLLGEALVAAGAVSQTALDGAIALQRDQDAPLGRILVAEDAITPQALTAALAAHADLPVVSLAESPPDAALLEGLDPYRCLDLEAMPWRVFGSTRVIAVANPGRIDEAAAAFGGGSERVAVVLASSEDVRAAVVSRFGARLRDDAATRCPARYSCRGIGSRGFRRRAVLVAAAILLAASLAPVAVLCIAVAWIVAMNLATTVLRGFALFARLRSGRRPVRADVPRLTDFKRLPTVSLIVPLNREAKVAGGLIRALDAIDYPRALLDIKLVLEEEDLLTRMAVDRAGLPPCFEVITVPKQHGLQTKPRAMNFALPFCRGSIVGVYDAEDRPDPAQLRAVVAALNALPPEVACVQGYLDFYNEKQNWLARCFTLEYAAWFRIILHGVQRLGLPIPLGGTTVFFRRRALEAVGCWDAHNVTEDAELGMRLARLGYRCEMIQTVTEEEANCHPWRWIGQRSRWLKGYAITWAAHMRAPSELLRDLGWRGFLGFQLIFLGGITSYLAMPLAWIAWSATLFGAGLWWPVPAWVLLGVTGALMTSSALMLAIIVMALRDAGRLRMVLWLPALAFYWPLGAVAAYRAVAEIFLRPFHWTKTEHGLLDEDAPGPKPASGPVPSDAARDRYGTGRPAPLPAAQPQAAAGIIA